MKKQTLDIAEMLIRHQNERMEKEHEDFRNLNANRIAALMTSVLNFYSELSALHTQALIEELENDVVRANV